MKKTIKIIDILNKIANGEEVPKKIKFRDVFWIYSEGDQDYLEYNKDDTDLFGYAFCNWRTLDFINDEVEILDEEEFEDIEEKKERLCVDYGGITSYERATRRIVNENRDMITQLIKNQKKIIEKLKESE